MAGERRGADADAESRVRRGAASAAVRRSRSVAADGRVDGRRHGAAVEGVAEGDERAIKGRKPSVTPATGDIRLHAKDARVHGQTLRYEPQPNKNVLGYWTNADDWADWEFEVATAGMYEVEIQQGCGKGSGGAEVAVEVGDQTLKFTVQETGHFQHMILRTIGQVKLAAGKHSLAVKPQTKPGAAVMDLRRVVLRPAQSGR